MGEDGPTVGFIGVGVLGRGLALALAQRGYRVAALYSRTARSAQWVADRVPGCRVCQTPQELADAVGLVFITTPDSVIGQIAATVSWRPGQGVVHCCGAASTEILRPVSDNGALAGAFHPFQTFVGLESPDETIARLSGVTFAVAAQGWLAGSLEEMARRLGGRPVSIPDRDRPLYHAAAVLGCGYLVGLLQAVVEVWQAMGFTPEEAVEALYPLSRATLDSVARRGVLPSLTGPVVRGDVATVHSHLEALFQRLPEVLPLYGALAAASLPLAARCGVGPSQITELRQLIDHYHGVE